MHAQAAITYQKLISPGQNERTRERHVFKIKRSGNVDEHKNVWMRVVINTLKSNYIVLVLRVYISQVFYASKIAVSKQLVLA